MKRVLAIGSVATLSTMQAYAALPTAVTDAIDGYETDATTAIGLLMAAGVVIWGLFKLARKFGWI